MNDHVAKPIEPDNLFKTLVQWIAPRDSEVTQAGFEPSGKKIAEDKLPGSLEGIDIAEGLRRVGGRGFPEQSTSETGDRTNGHRRL